MMNIISDIIFTIFVDRRTLILLLNVAALWLVLSGYLKLLLLGLGLASVALVIAIAERMNVVDHEGHPYHLHGLRVLKYWAWLLIEIAKANLDVARRIIAPSLRISPTLLRIPTSQSTELGLVIYANSITLTPGTVSIDLDGPYIEVHALSQEAAEGLKTGEMDRRVTELEVHN